MHSCPSDFSGLEAPDGQQQLMQAIANWVDGDAAAILVGLLQQVLLREGVLLMLIA
jgi:hypothetical protein